LDPLSGNYWPIAKGLPWMSLDKATLITMWGFGALYIGLMGLLLAINAPVPAYQLVP
jgi:hypothetical protein